MYSCKLDKYKQLRVFKLNFDRGEFDKAAFAPVAERWINEMSFLN